MKITVTDTQTNIPSNIGRKQLIIVNEGPDAVRGGWESGTTADDSAADGILIASGASLSLAGKDIDISGTFYLICATGETADVSYTERT